MVLLSTVYSHCVCVCFVRVWEEGEACISNCIKTAELWLCSGNVQKLPWQLSWILIYMCYSFVCLVCIAIECHPFVWVPVCVCLFVGIVTASRFRGGLSCDWRTGVFLYECVLSMHWEGGAGGWVRERSIKFTLMLMTLPVFSTRSGRPCHTQEPHNATKSTLAQM